MRMFGDAGSSGHVCSAGILAVATLLLTGCSTRSLDGQGEDARASDDPQCSSACFDCICCGEDGRMYMTGWCENGCELSERWGRCDLVCTVPWSNCAETPGTDASSTDSYDEVSEDVSMDLDAEDIPDEDWPDAPEDAEADTGVEAFIDGHHDEAR